MKRGGIYFMIMTSFLVTSLYVYRARTPANSMSSKEKIMEKTKRLRPQKIECKRPSPPFTPIPEGYEPKLDSSVDWNDPKQWPKEYKVDGKNVTLEIEGRDRDYGELLKTIEDLKPGWSLGARYYYEDSTGGGICKTKHGPSYWWRNDMSSIASIGFYYADAELYSRSFFKNGNIFRSAKREKDKYVTEYYDLDGKLVCREVWPHEYKENAAEHYWHGERVTNKTYRENVGGFLDSIKSQL